MQPSDVLSFDLVRPLAAATLSLFDLEAYGSCSLLDAHARDGSIGLKFFRWRRQACLLLALLVCGQLAWLIADDAREWPHMADGKALGLAVFLYTAGVAELLACALELGGLMLALYWHNTWRRSARVLLVAFFVPYCLSFAQFLWPVGQLFRSTLEMQFNEMPSDIIDAYRYFMNQTMPVTRANEIVQEVEHIAVKVILLLASGYVAAMGLMHMAMAGICLIPAIVRGAQVVREIMPDSEEMRHLVRTVPLILLPILLVGAIVAIQASDSYFIVGAAAGFIVFMVAPLAQCHVLRVRIAGLAVAVLFMALFLNVDDGGNSVVRNAVRDWLTPLNITRFLLNFFVKYNLLTLIMADHLLGLMRRLRAIDNSIAMQAYASPQDTEVIDIGGPVIPYSSPDERRGILLG